MLVTKRLLQVFLLGAALASTGCGLSMLIGGSIVASSRSSSSGGGGIPQTEVTSLSPNSGSHGEGQTVTINGANFASEELVVLFGDQRAEVEAFVSSQQVRVKVPALDTSGPTDVQVTSRSTQAGTMVGGFDSTNQPPSLSVDSISDGQIGPVAVRIQLLDSDSVVANDTSDLAIEFSSGGGAFQPVPLTAVTGGAGALQGLRTRSTAPGEAHVIVIDTRALVGNTNTSLQFRLTPTDTFHASVLSETERRGQPATTNSFQVSNNNAPTLTLVSAPAEDDNVVPLVFQVSDVDPNSTLTLVSARFLNVQTGVSANASVRATPNPDLAKGHVELNDTLPQGQNLTFLWDSLRDLSWGNSFLVTFELTISDGSNSTTRSFSPPFFVSNGPVTGAQTFNTADDPGTNRAEVADCDGDGDVDLVLSAISLRNDPSVSATRPFLHVFSNEGGGVFIEANSFYSSNANVHPGSLVVVPMDNAGTVTRRVFCVDVGDSLLGLSHTAKSAATGAYPEPLFTAPGFANATLGAGLANSRVRVAEVGDMNGDGRLDLLALIRDGNRNQADSADDAGTGSGQLVVFTQDGTGGFNASTSLLGAPVNLGLRLQSGGNRERVLDQAGDFHLAQIDGANGPDVVLSIPGANRVQVFTDDAGVSLTQRADIDVAAGAGVPAGHIVRTADFGDVDGDGDQDLVVLTNNNISSSATQSAILVYLATSSSPPTYPASPDRVVSIARRVDDLRTVNVTNATEGDSRDDVVVSDEANPDLGLYISAATTSGFLESGGSAREFSFGAGGTITRLSLGDVNLDGHTDISASANTSNFPLLRVSVPRLFTDAVAVATGGAPKPVECGDVLNDDGVEEAVSIDQRVGSGIFDVLVFTSDPQLILKATRYSPFRGASRARLIDFNNDGKRNDILHMVCDASGKGIGLAIIPNDSSDLVTTRPSVGGTYIDPASPPAGAVITAESAGPPAIVRSFRLPGGTIYVDLKREAEPLGAPAGFTIDLSFTLGLAYGDVGRGDADPGAGVTPLTAAGRPDLVFANRQGGDAEQGVFVLYGDTASGSYTRAIQVVGKGASAGRTDTVAPGAFFVDCEVEDMDGSGPQPKSILALPLVMTGGTPSGSKDGPFLLEQDVNGEALTINFFNPGAAGGAIVTVGGDTGDFNKDGFLDICIANNIGPTCNVVVHDGGAAPNGFNAPQQLTSELRPVEAVVRDINNDATDDIVMCTLGAGNMMVYTSRGDGTFTRQRNLKATEPFYVGIGDVNGDGAPDVLSCERNNPILLVFLGKPK